MCALRSRCMTPASPRWRAGVLVYLSLMAHAAYAPAEPGLVRPVRQASALSGPGREPTLPKGAASASKSAMGARLTDAAIAASAATAATSVSAAPSSSDRAVPPQGCPESMARVGKFCIDRHEAHLVVTSADGSERAHPHYLRPPASGRWRAESTKGIYPQAYLSRNDAQRACAAAGKRLCSWLEWKRACQGPKWIDYPNPDADDPGACNVGKHHLLSELFPKVKAGRWDFFEHFNNPKLNQEPGYLARTGDHERCATADGVYDMVGNLHEWVADGVSTKFMQHYQSERIRRHDQPWRLGNAIFMGGFFSTQTEHGHGCHFTTIAHAAKYHDYSIGFRCCSDARKD